MSITDVMFTHRAQNVSNFQTTTSTIRRPMVCVRSFVTVFEEENKESKTTDVWTCFIA